MVSDAAFGRNCDVGDGVVGGQEVEETLRSGRRCRLPSPGSCATMMDWQTETGTMRSRLLRLGRRCRDYCWLLLANGFGAAGNRAAVATDSCRIGGDRPEGDRFHRQLRGRRKGRVLLVGWILRIG